MPPFCCIHTCTVCEQYMYASAIGHIISIYAYQNWKETWTFFINTSYCLNSIFIKITSIIKSFNKLVILRNARKTKKQVVSTQYYMRCHFCQNLDPYPGIMTVVYIRIPVLM